MRVALDIDGTVLDWNGQPYDGVVERVRQLVLEDAFVGYVTYRSSLDEARTREQLGAHALPEGPVRACPPTGVADAAGVKAGHLDELEATHFVGDAPFDREAARRVGCEFVHAEAWRNGSTLFDFVES